MSCDLDPINLVCWTHGIDITPEDYVEGVCDVGCCEEEEEQELETRRP